MRVDAPSLAPGPDGRPRCWWSVGTPDYVAYHDEEWGRPVRDDRGLYEKLTLEAFQSGLSWLTILRKRENFRSAFHGFDFEKVARYGANDVERLMNDAGIVRNRAKIEAAIANARATAAMRGGLAELIWSYKPSALRTPHSALDLPSTTEESKALAKELKKRGFAFVGPTTVYSTMQACGVVNDHIAGCAFQSVVADELTD